MKVVAIKERSAGNETVGDMWLETAIFDQSTPVIDIIEWSKFGSNKVQPGNGKLIITLATDDSE